MPAKRKKGGKPSPERDSGEEASGRPSVKRILPVRRQLGIAAPEFFDDTAFDLADALAGQVKLLRDLPNGHRFITTKPESHLNELPVAFGQIVDGLVHDVAQELERQMLFRIEIIAVGRAPKRSSCVSSESSESEE